MRPKGSHANSHTANIIATARTYVTEREIPFKRRKQKLLLPLRLCSEVFASLATQLCQVCAGPHFQSCCNPFHHLPALPQPYGHRLGSNLLFP